MKKPTIPHVIFLVIIFAISCASAYVISLLTQDTQLEDLSWLIEIPSSVAIFSILYFEIYGKMVWRFRIFRWLGINNYPVIEGRWSGTLQSSYEEEGKKVVYKGVLEIEQTAFDIYVWAYFEKSKSFWTTANFIEMQNRIYLLVTYENEVGPLADHDMQSHKGTLKLEYVNNELIGEYFNNRPRIGSAEFKFEGSALSHRFGPISST